jgi:glycerol-3-phosphate dehydrogenase (NAD(P)+)
VVVPSVGVEELLSRLPRTLGLVLCAKGVARDGRRLTEVASELGFGRVAVLSGPNHAEEVGRGLPAASVVASDAADFAREVQDATITPTFRVYTSTDSWASNSVGCSRTSWRSRRGSRTGSGTATTPRRPC